MRSHCKKSRTKTLCNTHSGRLPRTRHCSLGTYGTACLKSDTGEILWKRRDLNCDHEVNAGPASSPTIIDNKLVVHVDGRDVQYINAESTDRETIWKTAVEILVEFVNQRKAFCMPFPFQTDEGLQQILSPGGRAIYSYDLHGNELWRVEHRGFSVAPRPVYGQGMTFSLIDRDNPELWAIRVNGKGNVTETHVAGKHPQHATKMFAHFSERFTDGQSRGNPSCLEAETGELVWRERLPGRYSASPIYLTIAFIFLTKIRHTSSDPVENLKS